MNRKDKKAFIRDLCNSVRDLALSRVKDMPEDWDGHELRALLADSFAVANLGLCAEGPRGDRARRRAFKNECLIRNL